MNIEQIADAVSKEMLGNVANLQPELVKWNVEYLRRCLEKLAEQEVEPMGYIYCYQEQDICFSTEPQDENIQVTYYWQERVFTETQLLAAQQRTAEACAKACESITKEYDMDGIYADFFANLISNGEWRKYL